MPTSIYANDDTLDVRKSLSEQPVYTLPGEKNIVGQTAGLKLNTDTAKRFGLENESEGVLNVFKENVVASSRNIASSFATALGAYNLGSKIKANTEMNQDYDAKDIKVDSFKNFLGSLPNWTAQSLGMAVPDITGAIAVGALTAGAGAPAAVGTFAYSALRSQGDNYRLMRELNPDAPAYDALAMSAVLSSVQGAIEALGGIESYAAKSLAARGGVTKVAESIIKKTSMAQEAKMLEKVIFSSKNRVVSIAKAGLAETSEEVFQGGAGIIAGQVFGGKEYSTDELFQQLVVDPLRALPAGGIMGGVFHTAKANGSLATAVPEVTPKDEISVFSVTGTDGQIYVNEEARSKSNAAFIELATSLRPVFNGSTDAAVSHIKSLSYIQSYISQVNYGQELYPHDFVESIKIGYLNANPTEEDIGAIDGIRKDVNIKPQDKGAAILSYLSGKYSKDNELYKQIYGIGNMVEASEIDKYTRDIMSTLNSKVPRMTEKEHSSWASSISEKVASLQSNLKSVLIGTQSGNTPRRIEFSSIKDEFSSDDIARMFIDEPTITYNGGKFVVQVDPDGISFVPESGVNKSVREMVDLYSSMIADNSKTAIVDGGIELLAMSKVNHALAENKIFMSQVIDSFNNRMGSEVSIADGDTLGEISQLINDIQQQKKLDDMAIQQAKDQEIADLVANERAFNAEQRNADRLAASNAIRNTANGAFINTMQRILDAKMVEAGLNKAIDTASNAASAAPDFATIGNDEITSFMKLISEANKIPEIRIQIKDEINPLDFGAMIMKAKEEGRRSDAIKIYADARKFYNAKFKAFDFGSIGLESGIRFEFGNIKFSDKTVENMSDEEIADEAKKLGVTFQGFFNPGRFPTFLDPVTKGNFTAMNDQKIIDAFTEHKQRWIDAGEYKEKDYASLYSHLFEEDGRTINGLYLPSERTAMFFANANAATVIHEFMHHARALLPIKMQEDLLNLYNTTSNTDEKFWSEDVDEWFANTCTRWIGSKRPPTGSDRDHIRAFDMARRLVASAYKNFNLSPQVQAAFDDFFGEIPDDEIVFGAKSAMQSMINQDPPTARQLADLIAGIQSARKSDPNQKIGTPPSGDIDNSVRFDTKASDVEGVQFMNKDDRNRINSKMHKIAGTHERVNEISRSVFGDSFTSIKDLSDDDFVLLSDIIETSSIVGDESIALKSRDDAKKILDFMTQNNQRKSYSRPVTSDPKTLKFFTNLKNLMAKVNSLFYTTISSVDSMTKALDGFQDMGVWHDVFYRPIKAAREIRRSIFRRYNSILSDDLSKSGINISRLQMQTVSINNQDYRKGTAMFMAIVSRMRSEDIDSYVRSNFADNVDQGYADVKEAGNIVFNDAEMSKAIDIMQNMFKVIHPELSQKYFEITQKEMGKLDWYVPFIRMNESDDLDVTLSSLKGVTPESAQIQRSSESRMHSREGGSGSRINDSDPFHHLMRYIDQASCYIGTAGTVKQILSTLDSDQVKSALRWKYGEGFGSSANWRGIHRIMTDLTRAELFYDGRLKPLSDMENMWRGFRMKYSVFSLAGNIWSSAKQILSAPLGAARSGAPLEVMARFTAESMAMIPRVIGNIAHNTRVFASGKGRPSDYLHVMQGTRAFDLIQKYSPLLAERHRNPVTGEALLQNYKGFNAITVSGVPFGELLMSGLTGMDALTVHSLWVSTFDSWTRKNKAAGMTEEDAMNNAAQRASDMISDSQPPTLPQEMNLLQRGNELSRSLFMFTGATMKQYEVFATDIVGRSAKVLSNLKAGGVTSVTDLLFKGEGLQSGIVQQVAIGFILPSIMYGMMTRRRKPTERELVFDILSYPVTALPFTKSLIMSMAGVEGYNDESSTYLQQVMQTYSDGLKAMMKAHYGDGWSDDNIRDAIRALSLMGSAPRSISDLVSASFITASNGTSFGDQLRKKYIDPVADTKELK